MVMLTLDGAAISAALDLGRRLSRSRFPAHEPFLGLSDMFALVS